MPASTSALVASRMRHTVASSVWRPLTAVVSIRSPNLAFRRAIGREPDTAHDRRRVGDAKRLLDDQPHRREQRVSASMTISKRLVRTHQRERNDGITVPNRQPSKPYPVLPHQLVTFALALSYFSAAAGEHQDQRRRAASGQRCQPGQTPWSLDSVERLAWRVSQKPLRPLRPRSA